MIERSQPRLAVGWERTGLRALAGSLHTKAGIQAEDDHDDLVEDVEEVDTEGTTTLRRLRRRRNVLKRQWRLVTP